MTKTLFVEFGVLWTQNSFDKVATKWFTECLT